MRLFRLRRWLAGRICPEMIGVGTTAEATQPQTPIRTTDDLVRLAEAYATHVARAEATISNRIVGHARLFSRLRDGQGCTINTADKAASWFSDHWPDDLEWPRDIPRPPHPSRKPSKKEAA